MPVSKRGSLSFNDLQDSAAIKRQDDLLPSKNVQFQPALDSSVSKEFVEAPFDLSDSIRERVWWTAKEQNENGKEYKELLKDFRETTEIDKEFSTLYKDCSSLSTTQVLRTKAAKQTLSEVTTRDGLRGLEVKLARTLSQRRKQHIRKMLSIKGQGASEEVLAGSSAESSRASNILARVLAQIDARAVNS